MKLGLTGGIGCGKSTVVGLFREEGWHTVESDAVVRELLAEDRELIEALCGRWGKRCLSENGEVDRRAVAAIVFEDKSELTWLEQLLHPKVREAWQAAVSEHPGDAHLVEIPLLFEKRLESAFDFTVCVHSPESTVEERMQARGYSRKELERRRRHQLPIEEKIRRADFVITNAGSLEFLNQQVARLITQLCV